MQDIVEQRRGVAQAAILVMALNVWTCSHARPLLDAAHWSDGHVAERGTPAPLSDHPGNVYLDSEMVWVAAPAEIPKETRSWRALDDRGLVIGSGIFSKDSAALPSRIGLGQLPVGWYRVEFLNEEHSCLHWTTAAVLKELAAPVPQDSPICVDSATAWFAKGQPGDQTRN